ncbi:MAG: hypothetical protein RL708_2351 [Bacteroidota bacterium]|jgi:hypothetical protein
MQAIRQIVDVKNNQLHVKLPASFISKRVEIIILPAEEEEKINWVNEDIVPYAASMPVLARDWDSEEDKEWDKN